jgi:hypothetical protein
MNDTPTPRTDAAAGEGCMTRIVRPLLNYEKLLIEALTLHDAIERLDVATHWSGCSCNYGCDGRMPRQGPKCKRCVDADRIREIKKLIDFNKPKREEKAKLDSLDSSNL